MIHQREIRTSSTSKLSHVDDNDDEHKAEIEDEYHHSDRGSNRSINSNSSERRVRMHYLKDTSKVLDELLAAVDDRDHDLTPSQTDYGDCCINATESAKKVV
jgi:hypothetical protein